MTYGIRVGQEKATSGTRGRINPESGKMEGGDNALPIGAWYCSDVSDAEVLLPLCPLLLEKFLLLSPLSLHFGLPVLFLPHYALQSA